jgi:hypothetical protein
MSLVALSDFAAMIWNEFHVSQVYTFPPLMSSYWERYEFEEAL